MALGAAIGILPTAWIVLVPVLAVVVIVLTVFDVIVIWLIWHEYRLMRQHPKPSA